MPLGRGMGKEALSQLNSLPTCSGEGYVGLPESYSYSIGNVDQLLHVASTLSLPKITSSSVDNLVQYSTIPESAIVENTVPPVISPYNLYRKKGSLPQGIRALIASKKHMNQKEQVHSSKMDHCSLPASTKEQYVTLSIPPDYISGWKAEARIALLDTRFLEYEHAVIGTVLTTLNAGSIVVTFFPNFAVSLSDPHVASAFKVQVQITGANQVPASVMATLHHQLVFRLQNHSLDLPNQGSRDAPMVLANSGTEIPTIIQIPRQIQRKDLEKLVPTEWITNYESLQQQHETVKSTDFRFKRLPDGRVKTIFKTQPDGEPSNPEFQLMITPIPVPKKIVTPVASFGADGHRIYTDRINGHFIWDVNPSMCDPECSCEEDDDDSSDDEDKDWSDYESDEDDDLSSCHDSDDDYDEPDPDERQAFRKPQSCMMFQYETDFPPMERYVDSAQKYSSKPYVQNNVVDTEGKLKPLTQAEEVLNWQTTNARAQNRSLTTLDAKMDRVLSRVQTTESKVEGMENQLQKIYDNLVQRIQQLDRDLRFLIDQRDFGMEFNQKEAEIRRLKKELAQMEQDRYKVTKPLPIYSPFTSQPLFTTQPLFGESPPSSPPDYSKYFFMASDIPTDLPKAPPKHTRKKYTPEEKQKAPQTSTPPASQQYASDTLMITKSKPEVYSEIPEPLVTPSEPEPPKVTKPIYPYEKEDEDTECASLEDSDIISEGSKDSETNLADITSILMADAESSRQPQEQVAENIEGEESDSDPETAEPTVLQPDISNTKPVAGPWFTFDDVPVIKRRERLHTFSAWIDLQLTREGATLSKTGAILPSTHPSIVLGAIHQEFIGDASLINKMASQEYFAMKCCSLKRKDLDFHFKRMSEKFYMLNGLNDPNLKHVFLASLPQELQPEIQRMITSTRRDVTQLSLGEFHQMTFAALDKLCEQQSFFKDLMDKKAILKKACSKSHLEIQCKKMCTCPSKLPRIKRSGKTKKKSLRFFRRRPFRKKKTDRCYLCDFRTTGDDTDIESLYSEQDEQTEDTVFAIHDITSDEEDEHSSVEEGDDPPSYLPIYMMQANSTVEVTIPAPQVEIQILQSPYDKPIKAIGFIDTGATKTMLNPEVLPDDAWRTHYEYFQAADGQKFSTSLITKKPIGIRFFPECIIWLHVIGSKLHGRDLLIGFDLYHKAQKLQVLPTGLKYKRYFQPFSTIPRIFAITDAPAPYADISNKLKQCCADSHADFKHPHPLWKNPEFFIQLPFKLNEDANPIKASHPGMTPDDLVLAREECNQLLALGLIEPTNQIGLVQLSINKRTEQIRGKKRLVIDYKALNHFLLDDKFPLPKTKVLFSYLAKAQIFSKFDLKSGFWQLGIDPNDRYKTAFCLPNASTNGLLCLLDLK
ncbi:UNVERIFIED_CONTAM: polyprotein [Sesamum calycinum]|uniref:Polyprotein n=1 Tax=Sesamum calycinum TaxID=2727403 RepID=A0AAW2K106_9LAMI